MRTFGGNDMELLDGCREGKHTPRLSEVLCPNCGRPVEVFVLMQGPAGVAGTLASDETCECGYVLAAGTPEDSYRK